MRKINLTINTLPLPAHGAVAKTGPDQYAIFIDSEQEPLEQAAAFLHEALHLWQRDFDTDTSADVIEARTHHLQKQIAALWLQQ